MYIDVGWGGSVSVLQRRHYEDIAVDVVLKAAKKVFEAKTWSLQRGDRGTRLEQKDDEESSLPQHTSTETSCATYMSTITMIS